MAVCSLIVATTAGIAGIGAFLIVMLLGAGAFTYALRGVYFAVFDEGRVPVAVTGTAVGLVSVVGYTPDIFMGPLMGALLDGSPGITGHQHLFYVLTGFSVVGLLATFAFRAFARRGASDGQLAEA